MSRVYDPVLETVDRYEDIEDAIEEAVGEAIEEAVGEAAEDRALAE